MGSPLFLALALALLPLAKDDRARPRTYAARMPISDAVLGSIQRAAAAGNVPLEDALTVANIESGFDPKAKAKTTTAGGLYQFLDKTWGAYGSGSKFDADRSAAAYADLYNDNRDYLRRRLGREPTSSELYLAHQQGQNGAAKILSNPDKTMRQLGLAKQASGNGGSAQMTAAAYAGMWNDKYASKRSAALEAAGMPSTRANEMASAGLSNFTARSMSMGGMPPSADLMGMGGLSHEDALAIVLASQRERQATADLGDGMSFIAF